MPRRRRIHVANGVYYLSLSRDRSLQPLFRDEDDYATFERILGRVLPATQAQALAFSWEPHVIRLVLQIGEVSTGRIMQRVMSQYAAQTKSRVQSYEYPLVSRHRAVIINASQLLLKLVHFVHWSAILTVPNAHPNAYARSSHPFYLRGPEESPPWLNTQVALKQWGPDRATALRNYRKCINTPPLTEDIDRFERGPKRKSPGLDREKFLGETPPLPSVSDVTVETVIETVSGYFNVKPARLLTGPRGREYTLMRALITWHAYQRNIATGREISTWLRRHPFTLLRAIRRYRRRRETAALFEASAFPELDSAPSTAAKAQARVTLERITEVVCQHFDVDPTLIHTGARSRDCTLLRALIAWHARVRNVATWEEIADRLRRYPSSLRAAVRNYSNPRQYPSSRRAAKKGYRNQRGYEKLFKPTAFPEIDAPGEGESEERMAR